MKKIILFFIFATVLINSSSAQDSHKVSIRDVEKMGKDRTRVQLYLSTEISFIHNHTDTVREVKKGRFIEKLNEVTKTITIRSNERGVIESYDETTKILTVRFDQKENSMKLPFRPNGSMPDNNFVFCALCMADMEDVSGLSITPPSVLKKKIGSLDYVLPEEGDISLDFKMNSKTKSKFEEKTSKGVRVKK